MRKLVPAREEEDYSNNTLLSHKFLVSEVKMNSQESVSSQSYNTKERSKGKLIALDAVCNP